MVVSPLISLMKDQVRQLNALGVSACYLGSAQTDPGVEADAMRGAYRLVRVLSPNPPRSDMPAEHAPGGVFVLFLLFFFPLFFLFFFFPFFFSRSR